MLAKEDGDEKDKFEHAENDNLPEINSASFVESCSFGVDVIGEACRRAADLYESGGNYFNTASFRRQLGVLCKVDPSSIAWSVIHAILSSRSDVRDLTRSRLEIIIPSDRLLAAPTTGSEIDFSKDDAERRVYSFLQRW